MPVAERTGAQQPQSTTNLSSESDQAIGAIDHVTPCEYRRKFIRIGMLPKAGQDDGWENCDTRRSL